MTTEEAWRNWWDAEGKHMERLPHHDAADHTASVTRIAWLNGAFGAADEIERLRNERNAFEAERDELIRISNKLKRERDEARRDLCHADEGWQFSDAVARIKAAERGWDCFKEKA